MPILRHVQVNLQAQKHTCQCTLYMYTHACIHVNVCFSIESVDQGFTVIIDNQLGRRKDAKSLLRIIQVIHHVTVTPFLCLKFWRRISLC